MFALSIIVLTAAVLRIAGDVARSVDLGWPFRVTGWLLTSVAIWLAIAGFGAWAPLWPALLVGLCGAIVELSVPRIGLRTSADVVIVLCCAILSVPSLGWINTLVGGTVIVTAAALIGYLPTQFELRVRQRLAIGMFAIGAFAVLPLSWVTMNLSPVNAWFMVSPAAVLNIGISTGPAGERIELDSGAIAWIDRPSGQALRTGAVFFHGNHRNGANQPAAIAIRRALQQSGHMVISIDHPGFGESPAPGPGAPLEAWNPLPAALEATDKLRESPDIRRVVAVGHSMGCIDVLRLLQHDTKIDAAVLFGAGLHPRDQTVERIHRSFHRERMLTDELPLEMTSAIHAHFYDTESLIRRLASHTTPILFITFGIEHDLILSRRDEMYNKLPYPKTRWDFEYVTHYMSSSSRVGIVIGDVRATSRIANHLADLTYELH